MADLIPADVTRHVMIFDVGDRSPMQEWAANLIWLGSWCRASQVLGKRLIVFAVLPSRELAAAFVGLGCLMAGARLFEDALSWPLFRALGIGRAVFWSRRGGKARYGGRIVGFEESAGTEFISVKLTKAPRKVEVGSTLKIAQAYFDDYDFTNEEPPTSPRAASLDAARQAMGKLVAGLNPKWIHADGAEALLVTGVSNFDNSIADLSLSIDGLAPITMADFLCCGRNRGQVHAKLRIDHPRGNVGGYFPLAILDGPAAFSVHEHLAAARNLLVILDRSEYGEDVHDVVLGLRSIAAEAGTADLQRDIPRRFAPSVEIAAYLIDDK